MTRELALAGVAVVATAIAIVARPATDNNVAVGPYTALAGVSSSVGTRTACGAVITGSTEGVAHPVLPCGVRLVLGYRGKRVFTRVIDRGPTGPGREFELSRALAERLGLTGMQRITWGYAAAP